MEYAVNAVIVKSGVATGNCRVRCGGMAGLARTTLPRVRTILKPKTYAE
jgi:hypothetical protein